MTDSGALIATGMIVGFLLGALLFLGLFSSELKKLRVEGRILSKKGVYSFVRHTPETMQEYLDRKRKEKELA